MTKSKTVWGIQEFNPIAGDTMTRYRVEKCFIPSMGSISAFDVTETRYETKEEQALWQINSMRRHDGLKEYNALPNVVKFTRIEEAES